MKKIIFLSIVILIFMALFTGCSQGKSPKKSQTLTLQAAGMIASAVNADSFKKSEMLDSAMVILEKAIKMDETNADANYWMGEAISKKYWDSGILYAQGSAKTPNINKTTEAVGYFKKALELQNPYTGTINILSPLDKLTSEWSSIAYYYLIYGDSTKAKEYFARAETDGGYSDAIKSVSKNFLTSCPENAILFTNGDMDNFGLIYWQLMENYRTDVKVINLALLNSYAYAVYISKNVPQLTYTEEQLAEMRPQSMPNNVVLSIQDQLVEHIIRNCKHEGNGSNPDFDPPVCFTTAVSQKNMLGYAKRKKMRGLVYEIEKHPIPETSINADITRELMLEKFDYKGMPEKLSDKDRDFSKLIVQNYVSAIIFMILYYDSEKRPADAAKIAEFAMDSLPYHWKLNAFAADLYSKNGMVSQLSQVYATSLNKDPNNEKLYLLFYNNFMDANQPKFALELMEKAFERMPESPTIGTALIRAYKTAEQPEKAEEIKQYFENLKKNKN